MLSYLFLFKDILFNNLKASDPLKFTDTKTYPKRVKEANKKTGLAEAISVAYGNSCSKPLTIASMDFSYIGGSMGSVVGERISRAIDVARKEKSNITFQFTLDFYDKNFTIKR